ncbi:MAG: OsmC family protein [Parahaliea sp.]
MSTPRIVRTTSTGQNYAHSVTLGRHSLVADEPEKLGGKDAGPAPFDLYLAALASCSVITLQMYAERKGWELGQVEAELALSFPEDGRPRIHRTFSASGSLSDEQWQRLLEIVAKTPVTKALEASAVISSERR